MRLSIVRGWVWLYTLGLPLEMRKARRTEIDSDLWDQTHAWGLHGLSTSGDASSVLLRCLRGVPADLLWRFVEARTHRISTQGKSAMQMFTMRSLMGISTIILMAVLVAATAAFTVQYDSYYNDPTRGDTSVSVALWPWVILGSPLLGAGILATIGGFGLIRRLPWLGTALFVSGVWVVAILFYWLQVPFAIAAIVSVFAIRWGNRRTKVGTRGEAEHE